MYFVDDIPLYLHTDASATVRGGYLFQIVDEVERPIAFVVALLWISTESLQLPERVSPPSNSKL
jgi:hypothetical protein